MLKQEYKEGETNLQAALNLAIKVLSKTLDTNKLTPDKGNSYILEQKLDILVIIQMYKNFRALVIYHYLYY